MDADIKDLLETKIPKEILADERLLSAFWEGANLMWEVLYAIYGDDLK